MEIKSEEGGGGEKVCDFHGVGNEMLTEGLQGDANIFGILCVDVNMRDLFDRWILG